MNLCVPASPELMSTKRIGIGDGWQAYDCLCRAGPHDRPSAEQQADVSVAMVVSGTFTFRSTHGSALLTPGTLLLINARVEFECRHEHAVGDRCISFHYTPSFLGSVAAALPASRIDFTRHRVPMLPELVSLFAEVTGLAWQPHPLRLEEIAVTLAVVSLQKSADQEYGAPRCVAEDVGRSTAVVEFIEKHYAQPMSLSRLAAHCGLSRFHLLRIFRRAVGVTPYQYLIRTRVVEAAHRLWSTRTNVSEIALESGFNDLSEFVRRFRRHFGVSPKQYRAERASFVANTPAVHTPALPARSCSTL